MAVSDLRRWASQFLPDAWVVSKQYRRRVGRPLKLRDPREFHQKICWLRLNRFTPLHSYCADKLTVAAYVASVVGPGRAPTTGRMRTSPTADTAAAVAGR